MIITIYSYAKYNQKKKYEKKQEYAYTKASLIQKKLSHICYTLITLKNINIIQESANVLIGVMDGCLKLTQSRHSSRKLFFFKQ